MGIIIILGLIAVFVIVFAATEFKIVQQSETMVIERLGKYSRTLHEVSGKEKRNMQPFTGMFSLVTTPYTWPRKVFFLRQNLTSYSSPLFVKK